MTIRPFLSSQNKQSLVFAEFLVNFLVVLINQHCIEHGTVFDGTGFYKAKALSECSLSALWKDAPLRPVITPLKSSWDRHNLIHKNLTTLSSDFGIQVRFKRSGLLQINMISQVLQNYLYKLEWSCCDCHIFNACPQFNSFKIPSYW